MSDITDELRELADDTESRYGYSTAAVDVMRDAADAILELRDRAQVFQAENAKLRELCTQMVTTVDCTLSDKRCALFSKCAVGTNESCLYEQELRELGIEAE